MITLQFHGPFSLASDDEDILEGCEHRDACGVYLWATLVGDAFRVTYIGETGRSFFQRTKEHLIQTLGGNYRVWDASLMRQGILEVVWGGLWSKDTEHLFPKFFKRYGDLSEQISEYLRSQVIFVAPTDCDTTLRRAIESAIASSIRRDGEASSLLPDDIRFVILLAERTAETVSIVAPARILGLPDEVTV